MPFESTYIIKKTKIEKKKVDHNKLCEIPEEISKKRPKSTAAGFS
jgi:hypothetical protein